MKIHKNLLLKVSIGLGIIAIIFSVFLKYLYPYQRERIAEKQDRVRIQNLDILNKAIQNIALSNTEKDEHVTTITESLKFGSKSDQVQLLQQILYREGVLQEESITGYMGAKTTTALGELQEKYDIARPGDNGYENFGPQTKDLVNRLIIENSKNSTIGKSGLIYISLPSASENCTDLNLPPLSKEWSYRCQDISHYQNSDGSGWIPIDFKKRPDLYQHPSLFIDPINSQEDFFFYTYSVMGDEFVLTSRLSSKKFLKQNTPMGINMNPYRFETGSSKMNAWAKITGLIGYWKLDTEFNGADDFATIELSNAPSILDEITVEILAKPMEAEMTSVLSANPDDDANRFNITLPWYGNTIIWDFGDIKSGGRLMTEFKTSWYDELAYWVFVSEPHGMNIYRNGELLSQSSTSSSFNWNAKTFYVGRGLSHFWRGDISEVRIYKRALDKEEIQLMYSNPQKQ